MDYSAWISAGFSVSSRNVAPDGAMLQIGPPLEIRFQWCWDGSKYDVRQAPYGLPGSISRPDIYNNGEM